MVFFHSVSARHTDGASGLSSPFRGCPALAGRGLLLPERINPCGWRYVREKDQAAAAGSCLAPLNLLSRVCICPASSLAFSSLLPVLIL